MDPYNPTPEDLLPEAIADRAARWITDLPPFKKATRALMDPKTSGRCCLGVAGHLLGIPDESLFVIQPTANEYAAIRALYGLRSTMGLMKEPIEIDGMLVRQLTGVNDALYAADLDHNRTAAFIRANVDLIWDEPLAGLIKERLG